jgi:hypothetical protein
MAETGARVSESHPILQILPGMICSHHGTIRLLKRSVILSIALEIANMAKYFQACHDPISKVVRQGSKTSPFCLGLLRLVVDRNRQSTNLLSLENFCSMSDHFSWFVGSSSPRIFDTFPLRLVVPLKENGIARRELASARHLR